MTVIFLLITAGAVVAGGFLAAFVWADGDQRLLVYEFICLWDPWKITFMLCFFQCFAYLTHDYCYEFLILLFHYFQGSFRYPSILPFSIIILDELHINYKTQYNNMA